MILSRINMFIFYTQDRPDFLGGSKNAAHVLSGTFKTPKPMIYNELVSAHSTTPRALATHHDL